MKSELIKMTELYETENNDVIWIKMKQKTSDHPNDLYIGSVYFSEENGREKIVEKIKKLGEDIESIRDKGGEIILQGDFNARTATERDFVENDKFDPEMSPVSYELPPRSSQDKVLNPRGKELLDLCKTHNLCIIHGRKTGDIPGSFTSFQPNGNSIIDYGIASQSLFQHVISFRVGDFKPWLSDHCPIEFNLDIRKACKEIDSNEQFDPLPSKWYWDGT